MQNCKKTELAERLATICTNEHIKIKTLADISGVLPQSLYDIKNGKIKTLSVEKARSINRVYPQYSVSWLITGENAEVSQDDKDARISSLECQLRQANERIDALLSILSRQSNESGK